MMMKHIFARAAMLLLVLSLAVPGLALAETEIPTGQVVQLTSGETYLFGTEALKVEFSFDLPDNEAQTVNLRVGEAENSYAGWYLVDKVYAAKLDGRNTFILAGDYGPSDDDWTEIFYYNPHTQTLVDLGGVGALPEDLQLHADGTFSGVIRADALYTWYRPADFIVATSYIYGEEGYEVTAEAVVEVPRYSYPMAGWPIPRWTSPCTRIRTSRPSPSPCRRARGCSSPPRTTRPGCRWNTGMNKTGKRCAAISRSIRIWWAGTC